MIFKTKRLAVRHLEHDDFAPFHEMQSDDEVMRYTTDHGNGRGLDEAENRKQLEHCIECYGKPETNFLVWAIVDEAESFVGTCAIVRTDDGENEIGYRFLRSQWGRGFGTEITAGLIDYAIRELEMDSLYAIVDVRNLASVKILDRSSLTFDREVTNEYGVTDRVYRWARET
ncbi:MAG: GNAT family N-acetyltransferase [Planctomycetota bacterium]